MENTIIERVTEIIGYYKISVKKFAELINMPQTTVNGYVTGKREPKIDFAMQILSHFENISSDWLLLGNGSMLRDQPSGKIMSNHYEGNFTGGIFAGGYNIGNKSVVKTLPDKNQHKEGVLYENSELPLSMTRESEDIYNTTKNIEDLERENFELKEKIKILETMLSERDNFIDKLLKK